MKHEATKHEAREARSYEAREAFSYEAKQGYWSEAANEKREQTSIGQLSSMVWAHP
jgi:hypothetical protein